LVKERVDLVLLDLKMPGMDGLEVMRLVSRVAPDTMIILLTAHGSLESAIEALRNDAFDYLLKPSTPQQILDAVEKAMEHRAETLQRRELIDQVGESIMKLKEGEAKEIHTTIDQKVINLMDGVVFDTARRELFRGRNPSDKDKISLTPAEARLLIVLLDNRGRVLTHRELVSMVQGYEVTDWEAPEVLRPLVSRLRQKLGNFPGGEAWVINVRGTGYVFERRRHERTTPTDD
jgi:DNA-binding response OmpR family regulator